MTLKEASGIFYSKIEIERIEKDLMELEWKVKIHEGRHEREIKATKDKLREKRIRLQQQVNAFEDFLSRMEDPEVRLILRLRCIDNLTWDAIGAEMHMDRRTAARKYYGFFKGR